MMRHSYGTLTVILVGTAEGQPSTKQEVQRSLSQSWVSKRILNDPRVRAKTYVAGSGNVVTESSVYGEIHP